MPKKSASIKLEVMICYVNGSYTNDPKISGFDLGLLRGLGIFDYFITYDRIPFRFSEHYLRLKKNSEKVKLFLHYSEKEVLKIVETLINKNPHGELSFRMILTAGQNGVPQFMILVKEIDRPPHSLYKTGAKLQTKVLPRTYPDIKSLFYMPAMLALNEAKAEGFFDVLGLSDDGEILEATTANFFAFINGTLVSPVKDVLPGVTGKIIRELADGLFPIRNAPIPLPAIKSFDEAFISSTNKEILPVSQIDDHILGPPGPKTKVLMEKFQKSKLLPNFSYGEKAFR